ncbi:MAG: nucleotidyl transferase AbiEii/AbiGii toxin family protein [Novosphingobium sp.]
MTADTYRDQVKLLLDILPLVMAEEVFGLKGGTAINLFEWDFPRLSVDIDLTYLPNHDRTESLEAISAALRRIAAEIERRLPPTRVTMPTQGNEHLEVKLHCQKLRTPVKIEVNPSLRGHLLPVRVMGCTNKVQAEFEAFAEARVVSQGELFGSKICAALDRQHPRDLFDVKLMLDGIGLTDDIRHGMIAALVSHGRPIAELLKPTAKDHSETYRTRFAGMTTIPFSYDDHIATLDRLTATIRSGLTGDDSAFLRSFEKGDPEWDRFPIAALADLPGPQFKLLNVRKFRAAQPEKHAQGIAALDDICT